MTTKKTPPVATSIEEANKIIAELFGKVETVISEKKEVMKMFDEKALEGMTETERKIAETLEQERVERAREKEEFEKFRNAIETEKKESLAKKLEERIAKVAKGDKEFEAKLRANLDLLDKMPRSTDSELDAVVDSAYKLTGQKEPNPLNNGGHSSNNPPTNGDQMGYSATPQGKALAGRLGLVVETPKAPDAGAGAGAGGAK